MFACIKDYYKNEINIYKINICVYIHTYIYIYSSSYLNIKYINYKNKIKNI